MFPKSPFQDCAGRALPPGRGTMGLGLAQEGRGGLLLFPLELYFGSLRGGEGAHGDPVNPPEGAGHFPAWEVEDLGLSPRRTAYQQQRVFPTGASYGRGNAEARGVLPPRLSPYLIPAVRARRSPAYGSRPRCPTPAGRFMRPKKGLAQHLPPLRTPCTSSLQRWINPAEGPWS